MRLFHVSEDAGIRRFEPRIPERKDLDKTTGLVWAIDDARLPNFLTPRNCPRVAYYAGPDTSPDDAARFFSSPAIRHALVIESRWFDAVKSGRLYLYEFCPDDFVLQDETAGYYVAKTAQTPIARFELRDLFGELIRRNVEIRIVDNLWAMADAVRTSTLQWSLCRMAFAQPRG